MKDAINPDRAANGFAEPLRVRAAEDGLIEQNQGLGCLGLLGRETYESNAMDVRDRGRRSNTRRFRGDAGSGASRVQARHYAGSGRQFPVLDADHCSQSLARGRAPKTWQRFRDLGARRSENRGLQKESAKQQMELRRLGASLQLNRAFYVGQARARHVFFTPWPLLTS